MPDNICVDLYCGLGGWAEGFLAERFTVIGFDIEKHDYGTGAYPGQLVLQDVLTLHGSQFKHAAVIVASPPCTEPSYRAMPWKRAKALNVIGPPHKFIAMFEACFRIQREASEAAGRYIPLIVENVCGAQRWVGRAAWHFGSYYLWGDLPALMPIPRSRAKISGQNWSNFAKTGEISPHWRMEGLKLAGNNSSRMWSERRVQRLCDAATDSFYRKGSSSMSRKMASAQIAKIPFPLAHHIAKCFKVESVSA